VITAVPAVTPVSAPEVVLIIAMAVLLLVHVPPVGLPVRTVALPVHTLLLPVIAEGSAFTVKLAVL